LFSYVSSLKTVLKKNMSTSWNFDNTVKTKLLSVVSTETSLVFPKVITEIAGGSEGSTPISGCSDLVNISFEQGSSLTTLGEYCFCKTKNLKNADFSNCLHLKAISSACFYLSSVEFVTLPEGGALTVFQSGAFSSSKLKSIKIPDTLTTIYGYDISYHGSAFTSCTSLTAIEISKTSNLKTIGYAIAQNVAVTSIFVPKSVDSLNSGAFNLMIKLSSLIVDEENPKYRSIDNIIYNKALTDLIFCACDKPGDINLEKTVSFIEEEAFRGCRKTSKFVVPEGITVLFRDTFDYSLFTDIILPSTLQEIKDYAAENTAIKTIRIPSSVTCINSNAFYHSQLRTVYFEEPKTSLQISNDAFRYCSDLVSIVLPSDKISVNFPNAFSGTKLKNIYYLMNYPTKRPDLETMNIRYHAKIIVPTDKKNLDCGNVELMFNQDICKIRNKCTTVLRSSRIGGTFLISMMIMSSK